MSAPTRTQHLLIASHGAWSGPGTDRFLADGAALAGTGADVTVLLVADAVPLVADGAPALSELLTAGGEVLVDRFAAAQRGVAGSPLPHGARWVELSEPAEFLLDPDVKVVWH